MEHNSRLGPSSNFLGFNPPRTDPSISSTVVISDHESQTIPPQLNIHTCYNTDVPTKNKWRVIACVLWAFALGYSDAIPGTVLPHIEKYYNIGYSLVSFIFIANALGIIAVTIFAHEIEKRIDRQHIMELSCFLLTFMYALVGTGTSFPVITLGFFIGGLGTGIGIPQTNIFLARFDKKSSYLSWYHGSYGIGATLSPVLSTVVVNSGVRWSYFYFTLTGIMIFVGLFLHYSFDDVEQDLEPFDIANSNMELVSQLSNEQPSNTANSHIQQSVNLVLSQANERTNPASSISRLSQLNQVNVTTSDIQPRNHINTNEDVELSHLNRILQLSSTKRTKDSDIMKIALKNRNTWLLSLFAFFYQGSEVALGAWVVTFLLDYRKGNPSSMGYTSSGFWAGLGIGRLFLTKVLFSYIGIRRGVIICSIVSLGLSISIWVIPNVIISACLISIIGITSGPNYPLMVSFTTVDGLLPRKIQLVTMSIMIAFGSIGGALFPFIIGLLNQRVGTYVLFPVVIALYVSMMSIWILLPNPEHHLRHGLKKFAIFQKLW